MRYASLPFVRYLSRRLTFLSPVQNARLHAFIAQLQSSLDSERALAVDEDAELVALLSAKLAARSSRRAETFDRTCEAAGGAVDEVARSREAQVAKRSEQLDEMEERNEWLAEAMKGRLGEVEQRGEEGKKASAVSQEALELELSADPSFSFRRLSLDRSKAFATRSRSIRRPYGRLARSRSRSFVGMAPSSSQEE